MSVERSSSLAVWYLALKCGHSLGDYVTQTDRQAKEKAAPDYNITKGIPYGRTWLANQKHCLTYHAAVAATVSLAAAVTGARFTPRRAALALAVSWGSHAILDRRWPVKKIMEWTGSGDWYPDGAPQVDQALHDAFLFLSALILCAGSPIAASDPG